MLLYVIRHGETTFNAEGRIQGQLDTQLSPLGRAQAEAIARAMTGSDIQAVFASPLSRAYETARPLAAACRLEIRTDDRLKELNAGVFQNLLPAEMAERYPEVTARWKSHDPDYRIPEGESRRDLMVRGAAAFEAIFASGLQTVAVVAHGGLLTAALYKKFVTQSKRYHAHDEQGRFKAGDTVRIRECRPLSKLKRWEGVADDAAAAS